jgi:hypothetical protein
MVLVRSTRSKQAHDENIVVEAGKISFIVPNCSTNGTRISELHVDRVLSFTNPCKKLEIELSHFTLQHDNVEKRLRENQQ